MSEWAEPRLIVFDIDGTLSDPAHRLHHLEARNWDAFFAACDKDAPLWPGLDTLAEFIAGDWDVELWTGRPERTRAKTIEWLERHGVEADVLTIRMRADGDHRPDTDVKPEYLVACGRRPWIIFEDRASVVATFRACGLTVYQVAPGEF